MLEVLMINSAVAELLGFQFVDSEAGTFVQVPNMDALLKLFNYMTKQSGWFRVCQLTSQLIAIQ